MSKEKKVYVCELTINAKSENRFTIEKAHKFLEKNYQELCSFIEEGLISTFGDITNFDELGELTIKLSGVNVNEKEKRD